MFTPENPKTKRRYRRLKKRNFQKEDPSDNFDINWLAGPKQDTQLKETPKSNIDDLPLLSDSPKLTFLGECIPQSSTETEKIIFSTTTEENRSTSTDASAEDFFLHLVKTLNNLPLSVRKDIYLLQTKSRIAPRGRAAVALKQLVRSHIFDKSNPLPKSKERIKLNETSGMYERIGQHPEKTLIITDILNHLHEPEIQSLILESLYET